MSSLSFRGTSETAVCGVKFFFYGQWQEFNSVLRRRQTSRQTMNSSNKSTASCCRSEPCSWTSLAQLCKLNIGRLGHYILTQHPLSRVITVLEISSKRIKSWKCYITSHSTLGDDREPLQLEGAMDPFHSPS